MRTTVYAPFLDPCKFWRSLRELAIDWTFGDWLQHLLLPQCSRPRCQNYPPQPNQNCFCTVALPTSALLSPAAQSPVQVGRKKPTLLNQNQNLEQKVRRQLHFAISFFNLSSPSLFFFGFSVDRPQSLFDLYLKKISQPSWIGYSVRKRHLRRMSQRKL